MASDYTKARQEAAREYDEKGKALFAMDEKFKAQKSEGTWTDADQERFDTVAAEAMDAKARYEEAKRMETVASDLGDIAKPVGVVEHPVKARKTAYDELKAVIGDAEGDAFFDAVRGALADNVKLRLPGMAFKSGNTLSSPEIAADSLVVPDYTGNIVEYPLPPTDGVFSLFDTRETSVNVWKYFREDAPTNSAAEVQNILTSTDVKPTSDLAFELQTEYAHVVAHNFPVHKTQIANIPQLMGLIDTRGLRYLALRVANQLIWGGGDGTQGNDLIQGLANRGSSTGGLPGVGSFSSNGTTATALLDDIKAMATKSYKATWEEPTVALMTPELRDKALTAKTSGSGEYVYGVVPFMDGGTASYHIWSLNLVASPFAENSTTKVGNVIVGNPAWGNIVTQSQANTTLGYVNQQFIQNAMTVLCETTVGLEVYKPFGYQFMAVAGIS